MSMPSTAILLRHIDPPALVRFDRCEYANKYLPVLHYCLSVLLMFLYFCFLLLYPDFLSLYLMFF